MVLYWKDWPFTLGIGSFCENFKEMERKKTSGGNKKGAARGTAPTPLTAFRPWPLAAHEEKKPPNFNFKYCATEP